MPKITLAWAQPAPPYIRYFQIVREVLEESINAQVSASGRTRAKVCEAILAHAKNCSKEWFSNGVPQIEYKDPLCRLAYLYLVVPATANLIESVFTKDNEIGEHFKKVSKEKGTVSICAFGGGPGTELLGVCKWAEQLKPKEPIQLEYLLLDRVSEWLDSWKAIKKRIESRIKKYKTSGGQNPPLAISGMFSPVDIKDTGGLANLGSIFDQDIFILSYLVSEIFANFEDFRDFTQQVVHYAPKGAKFLFVDRNGPRWKKEIKTLAGQAGIKLSPFNDTEGNMFQTEQISDLGSLKTDIGISAKLTWKAFWVVGTKK